MPSTVHKSWAAPNLTIFYSMHTDFFVFSNSSPGFPKAFQSIYMDIGCHLTQFQYNSCTWPFLEDFLFVITSTYESFKHKKAP